MAIDAAEPSSPLSPSAPHFSQQRHFYLAVDRLQYKKGTLVDLLTMAGKRPSLPMVVCCSSRDDLDDVCSAVSQLPFITLSPLYSDLAETERALVMEKFRQAAIKWDQNAASESGHDGGAEEDDQKSHMIVITDACLPILASGESPLSAHLLINYELPTKKETYTRRIATCLAPDGIVINMVIAGEVVNLKSIEESSNIVIEDMPINISEIL